MSSRQVENYKKTKLTWAEVTSVPSPEISQSPILLSDMKAEDPDPCVDLLTSLHGLTVPSLYVLTDLWDLSLFCSHSALPGTGAGSVGDPVRVLRVWGRIYK